MVRQVLVDTDVLVDISKGRYEIPNNYDVFISEVTLYEFMRGFRRPLLAKKALDTFATVLFADNKVLLRAAELWRVLKESGRPVGEHDVLNAAFAIVHGLPVLTRNVRHYAVFEREGILLLEP